MNSEELKSRVEAAWADRTLLQQPEAKDAIAEVMAGLDAGALRVAQPLEDGRWQVNEWVKQAVLLNFPIQKMVTQEVGPFEFHDKMPLKKGYAAAGVRVVPHAVVRHGAFVARDCILMPSYVNLGAYVGERTMVDTWATVGSCAQIGADVHLSGGVGIGGVLEPLQAAPVIVEDGAFIAHVRSSLQERVPSMLTSDGGPPPATEAAYMDQSMRRAWASAAFRKVQQPSC